MLVVSLFRFHVLLDLLASAQVVPARCFNLAPRCRRLALMTRHPTTNNTRIAETKVTLRAHLE
jgi:hypothetical protein